MGNPRHPIGLWIAVLSGTLITAILSSYSLSQPDISRFGDPQEYTQIYTPTQTEQWGAHPVEFYVDDITSQMSLEQKISSLIIANQPGIDPGALESFVAGNSLGGFILMGTNIPPTPEELQVLTSSLEGTVELPRLIAIDEEGGQVTRLPYDAFAGADILRNEPVDATQEAFSGRGKLLTSVGVNLNFGIVADVSSDPHSFIYERSFGSDALSVAERVDAAVEGEDNSVLSTVKHFPGHGSAPGDSHVGVPTSSLTYDQWLASDAIPFQTGIDSGAQFVMFGHLSFPAIDSTPASLSVTWHNILRQDMGFQGLIITDDMTMLEKSHLPEYSDRVANAIAALAAGNDVLLYVPGADFDANSLVAGIAAAVRSGQLSEQNIDDSLTRVLTQRRELYPEATTWVPPCDERCFVRVTY